MTMKNYNTLEVQLKLKEIDNKVEQTYVDEKVNDINANINDISTNISNINMSLEEKADEADLQVERARIDSFTNLAEGSTTGDAELVDGRVGG